MFLASTLNNASAIAQPPVVGPPVANAFVSRWKAIGNSVLIPLLASATSNFDIDWGDGTAIETYSTSAEITHGYPDEGEYTITITGDFKGMSNPTTAQGARLLEIVSYPPEYYTGRKFFNSAWRRFGKLKSIPFFDCSDGENFSDAWRDTDLEAIPDGLNFSKATLMNGAWMRCNMQSMPVINTSSNRGFVNTWFGNEELAELPLLDTSEGRNFSGCCRDMRSLVFVPAWDTRNSSNYVATFRNCVELVALPLWDFHIATNCTQLCLGAKKMRDVTPEAFFESPCTRLGRAFEDCALSEASVNNIFIGLNAAGTSDGFLDMHLGTSAAPTGDGLSAKLAMEGRGWAIQVNS